MDSTLKNKLKNKLKAQPEVSHDTLTLILHELSTLRCPLDFPTQFFVEKLLFDTARWGKCPDYNKTILKKLMIQLMSEIIDFAEKDNVMGDDLRLINRVKYATAYAVQCRDMKIDNWEIYIFYLGNYFTYHEISHPLNLYFITYITKKKLLEYTRHFLKQIETNTKDKQKDNLKDYLADNWSELEENYWRMRDLTSLYLINECLQPFLDHTDTICVGNEERHHLHAASCFLVLGENTKNTNCTKKLSEFLYERLKEKLKYYFPLWQDFRNKFCHESTTKQSLECEILKDSNLHTWAHEFRNLWHIKCKDTINHIQKTLEKNKDEIAVIFPPMKTAADAENLTSLEKLDAICTQRLKEIKEFKSMNVTINNKSTNNQFKINLDIAQKHFKDVQSFNFEANGKIQSVDAFYMQNGPVLIGAVKILLIFIIEKYLNTYKDKDNDKQWLLKECPPLMTRHLRNHLSHDNSLLLNVFPMHPEIALDLNVRAIRKCDTMEDIEKIFAPLSEISDNHEKQLPDIHKYDEQLIKLQQFWAEIPTAEWVIEEGLKKDDTFFYAVRPRDQKSALQMAVGSQHPNAVRDMYKKAPTRIHHVDINGRTVWHMLATTDDNLNDLMLLVEEVTKDSLDIIEFLNRADNNQMTPIAIAHQKGAMGMAERLFELTSSKLCNIIAIAMEGNQTAFVQWMLDKMPIPDGDQRDNFLNILNIACKMGQKQWVEILLTKCSIQLKENILKNKKDGDTALHIAAYYGHIEIVQLLIDNGAKPKIRNRNGYRALQLADQANHTHIVV